VGTGGWSYLPIPSGDRLKAYSNIFNFVEVNSTFYEIPSQKIVRSWRARVPDNFVFSVKCNNQATHKFSLIPSEPTMEVLDSMANICRHLRSKMLVIQTPSRLRVGPDKVMEVSDMLSNLNLGKIQVFWEARGAEGPKSLPQIHEKMIEEGITPVIDLSISEPVLGADVIYSRLFSHGALQYEDATLEKIHQRIQKSSVKRAVLTFHGASMYGDAMEYLDRVKKIQL
jgi:uncharacterized protein YecE (DUF72 family)